MAPEATPGRWSGRRVAVLGGAGFIGSNLAARLAELGARVTVLDGLVEGCGGSLENLDGIREAITFVRADLREAPVPDALLESEVVFNLLGDPAHARSVANPQRDLAVNLSANIAFLEAVRRSASRPSLILGSTRSVYGAVRRLPADELLPLAPPDPNGIHKVALEQYYQLYSRMYGIPSVRLRLTNVYGPRQGNADPAHGVTGFVLGRLVRNEPVTLFGGGTFQRDWLFVADAVDALLAAAPAAALESPVYNVGHDRPATLREFVELACALLGRGEVVQAPLPDSQRAIDVGDYWTDARAAEAAFGWRARTGLREGLMRTLEFYTHTPQGVRWPPAECHSSI